jgi:hypothetical protein
VRGHVPVEGTVGRVVPFRSTLVPRGGGRHRLFLNGEVREAAGVGEGDRVRVELRIDRAPRAPEVPPDLARALDEARAGAAFEGLTPFKRREILVWIEAARREDTRNKRIAKAVEHALGVREKAIDRAARG